MEDTQEELNEEDIEESTADVDTPPEEVVEEEIVDNPDVSSHASGKGTSRSSPIEPSDRISQK